MLRCRLRSAAPTRSARSLGAALFTLLAIQADAAEVSRKTVGSWTVVVSEPDPGRLVKKLSADADNFSIELYCNGGNYRLFMAEFSEKDTADHTSPVMLKYSIDNGPLKSISGTGHQRYRFEMHFDASPIVADLYNVKKQLSFAIEPRKKMTTVSLADTARALESFSDECPRPISN